MKPYKGPPMTLGGAAAAQVRLIVWCKGLRPPDRAPTRQPMFQPILWMLERPVNRQQVPDVSSRENNPRGSRQIPGISAGSFDPYRQPKRAETGRFADNLLTRRRMVGKNAAEILGVRG